MSADALANSPSASSAVVPAAVLHDAQWDQSVVLADVQWSEYVLLRDKPANRGLRMTYAMRVLEIMTQSSFHELISLFMHDFILEWRVARGIPVRPSGSSTLRRELLHRGLEGDQSYYIQPREFRQWLTKHAS